MKKIFKNKTGDAERDFSRASLEEGLNFIRGEKTKLKVEVLRVRTTFKDVKEARAALDVSQPQFARLLQVSPEAVKKWEQGVNPVPGAVSQWVQAAIRHPKQVKTMLLEITEAPQPHSV
jgi:DNA-binding transcriptional regulator YiaG